MTQVRMANTDSYVTSFQSDKHSTDEAYLFLHSFPGTRGKNEDIAEATSHKTGCNSYILHYAGLGLASGKPFDFIKSIEESIQLARSLLDKYKILHLVGHSWGGLIALNIFSSIFTPAQRGQLILLAPFTEFPHDGSVESWLIPIAEQQDIIQFSHANPEKVKDNFFSVETIYNPRKNLTRLALKNKQVALIEAIDDPDVPKQSTDSLYKLLSQECQVQRIQLEDDHCFNNNRAAIITAVLGVIDAYINPSANISLSY